MNSGDAEDVGGGAMLEYYEYIPGDDLDWRLGWIRPRQIQNRSWTFAVSLQNLVVVLQEWPAVGTTKCPRCNKIQSRLDPCPDYHGY